MQQTYNGVDVYGGSVSLAVDEDGNCDTLVDSFIPGVTGDTKADLTPEQAAAKLSKAAKYSEIEQALFVKTVLYPIGDSYRLAHQYLVNAFDADGETLRCDEVFVDADTGEILDTFNTMSNYKVSETSITYTDVNGDPLTYTLWKEGDVIELYDPDRNIRVYDAQLTKTALDYVDINGNSTQTLSQVDDYRLISEYINNETPSMNNRAVKFTSEMDGYSNVKSILEMAEECYDYYRSFGMDGFSNSLRQNNESKQISIVVNDLYFHDNAAAYTSLSRNLNGAVILISPELSGALPSYYFAHEYTHCIFGAKQNLYSNKNTAAINEAYADIMAFSITKDTSWSQPDETGRNASGEIRFIGDQEWNSNTDREEHSDSEVISRAAYLIAHKMETDFGMTAEEALDESGKLWYDSMSYMRLYSDSFQNCLRAVQAAAKGRGYDADKLNMIRDCFRAVGIELDHNLTTFVVVDEDGKPIRPSWLSVDSRLPLMSMAVEKNVVNCSLRNGEHYVNAEKSGYEKTKQYFTVDDEETVVTVVMKEAEPVEIHIGDPVKPTEATSEEPTEAKHGEIINSGNCGEDGDNVTWKLDNNGTLTISGNGNMKDYLSTIMFTGSDLEEICRYGYLPPWYIDKKSITSIIIEDGVKKIGDYAFEEYNNLTSAFVPASVTIVGQNVFYGCENLNSVTLKDGITQIGNGMFAGCIHLKKVNIPSSVESIEEGAFAYCGKLNSITIPGSVTTIHHAAFSCCTSLSSVTIQDGVTSIEFGAFGGCTSLRSITFPDSVTNIESDAFYKCTSLSSVTIPTNISIHYSAFQDCSNLTTVYYKGTKDQFYKEKFDPTEVFRYCEIRFLET